ncbi:uncharacterized protein VP01_9895g1, partial [Puccinia sorghi]
RISVADTEGAARKANIPKLDKKNFLNWSMRIKAHLLVLSGAAADAVGKKHTRAVDILMNYMTKTVFELSFSNSHQNPRNNTLGGV